MSTFKQRERIIIAKEKRWLKEKEILEREKILKNEKRKFFLPKINKITTSKILVWFLFLNCTIIELFVGYVTIKSFSLAQYISCMPDFSPLVTLVGAVVSEVIGYAIYSAKSTKENTVGGITYDMAMKQIENSPLTENNAMG